MPACRLSPRHLRPQADLALTQVLDRPMHGRLFFEHVIRENLGLGRTDRVPLIFDAGSSVARPVPPHPGARHRCKSTAGAPASSSITREGARCGAGPPSRRSSARSVAMANAPPACASPTPRSRLCGTPCGCSVCSLTASVTPTCAKTSPTSKAALPNPTAAAPSPVSSVA